MVQAGFVGGFWTNAGIAGDKGKPDGGVCMGKKHMEGLAWAKAQDLREWSTWGKRYNEMPPIVEMGAQGEEAGRAGDRAGEVRKGREKPSQDGTQEDE